MNRLALILPQGKGRREILPRKRLSERQFEEHRTIPPLRETIAAHALAADAEREVEVIIEPAKPTVSVPREDWRQFVQETAGAWQGEPPQGDYEHRDELS